MTNSITDVHGVGPAMADQLAALSIKTVEQLAAADAGKVAEVRGISAAMAEAMIEDAKSLLAGTKPSAKSRASKASEAAANVAQVGAGGKKADTKKGKKKKAKKGDKNKDKKSAKKGSKSDKKKKDKKNRK